MAIMLLPQDNRNDAADLETELVALVDVCLR